MRNQTTQEAIDELSEALLALKVSIGDELLKHPYLFLLWLVGFVLIQIFIPLA